MLPKKDNRFIKCKRQAEGLSLLQKKHKAFVLSETEQGRTDLVQFKTDTGDAVSKRQPVCRMPFAVPQEVQCQLKVMEEMGIVQPSSSPWASPTVLVRKKRWYSQILWIIVV